MPMVKPAPGQKQNGRGGSGATGDGAAVLLMVALDALDMIGGNGKQQVGSRAVNAVSAAPKNGWTSSQATMRPMQVKETVAI